MKSAIIPCSTGVCHSLDWKKQLSQAISTPQQLLERLNLTAEQMGDGQAQQLFRLKVPHAYVDRMQKGNPNDPLLRQVWPSEQEFNSPSQYLIDPLGEQASNPIPGLLHKYQSRALTISTASCAINCRYCFRRAFNYADQAFSRQAWQQWITYLKAHPEINEVILSGGDPLMLADAKLAELISALEQLPQLKRLRIHSRLPLVIPERITDSLLDLAANSRLKWILVWHINHPQEIDDRVAAAAKRCQQANILQLNQAVLLRGVNADNGVLKQLSEQLFDIDILPYYLHLLDKVTGAAHFDLPKPEAQAIYAQLMAQLPGFLVPKLVQEVAGEPSKSFAFW